MQKISPETPYQPISCELHSQYELAIMYKTRLQLVYRDKNNFMVNDIVMPIDIKIKNKAEYLIALSAENKTISIRLDYIIKLHVHHRN